MGKTSTAPLESSQKDKVVSVQIGDAHLSMKKSAHGATLELLRKLADQECRSVGHEMKFLVERRAAELGMIQTEGVKA